jgi:hypothetical protein
MKLSKYRCDASNQVEFIFSWFYMIVSKYHITDCKVFLDLQNLTSRMVFGAIVWTGFFLVKLQRHTSKWKYLKPEVKENLLSTCEYTTYLIFCLAWFWGILIKFHYSEKATKFEKIFHLKFCGLLGEVFLDDVNASEGAPPR